MTAAIAIGVAMLVSLQDYEEARNCDDPQNQAEMTACAAMDFERADLELNWVWREVINNEREADREIDREYDSRPTGEAVIREAQRAWITFRDAQCTFEGYEARGGSMEPMIVNGCRARLTRERIAQLSPNTSEQ